MMRESYLDSLRRRVSGFAATLDRFVEAVAPEYAVRRAASRQALREFATSWRTASRTRTDRRSVFTGHPDAINELQDDRERILETARQLERDNVLAKALLDRYSENVVGTGVQVMSASDDPDWNAQADDLWHAWMSDCDVRGLDSFAGLLRLTARSWKRDGDVLTVKVSKGPNRGRLQLVEADQIRSPAGLEKSSPRVVNGVEIDGQGRPTKYWVIDPGRRESNDRRLLSRVGQLPLKSISAEDAVFLASRNRIGQTRGVSAFAQAAWLFHQIDKTVEAVTLAARMAACFGVVIRRPGGFPGLASVTGSNDDSYGKLTLEPAMVKTLEVGEEISTLDPSQPKQNLVEFITMLSRLLGTAFAFPLELVMLDFSRTNYSSARAALLQAQQAFKVEQQNLVEGWVVPVRNWRVRMWIEDGALPENPMWDRVNVLPHRWGSIDPSKEVAAEMAAVDAGFKSRTEVISSRGRNIADVVKEISEEQEMYEEAAIVVSRANTTREETTGSVMGTSDSVTVDVTDDETPVDGEEGSDAES